MSTLVPPPAAWRTCARDVWLPTALEMAEFTKLQILAQTGVAMMAQANQIPQTVLRLIG